MSCLRYASSACFAYVYRISAMFDYYSRDSELSYISWIRFQSTPPLEGAGVFNVPEGDSPQITEPPFIASMIRTACQPDQIACLCHA